MRFWSSNKEPELKTRNEARGGDGCGGGDCNSLLTSPLALSVGPDARCINFRLEVKTRKILLYHSRLCTSAFIATEKRCL